MNETNVFGFPVVFHRVASPVVSIRIVVNAGSYQDQISGTAHFLEYMFFKSTEDRSYAEMNRAIAAIGDSNAYTSVDRTVFYINTTARYITRALDLLCEMLFKPKFDPEELEKERGVIVEEWQASQDDPVDFFIGNSSQAVLGSKLGHPPVGTKDGILAITRDDLLAFRATHYRPGNILIGIVGDLGDLSETEIADILIKYSPSSNATAPNVIETIPSSLGPWEAPRTFGFTHTAKQACLGFWMPGLSLQESYDTFFADDIGLNLMGGGMHSFMFDRLREQLGLCYTTGALQVGAWDNTHTLAFCLLDRQNIERASAEIRGILTAIAKGEFSNDLLEASTANTLFGLAAGVQTPAGWARTFLDCKFCFDHILPGIIHGYESFKDRVDYVITKAGTPDRLRELIREWAEHLMSKLTITTLNGD